MTTLEKLEELIYYGFKETDRRIDERFQETHKLIQELQSSQKELQYENYK